MNLKDKIAVVTGGSSGIGQAICIALAKEGCKVVFTYNTNEKGADETLKKLNDDSYKFKDDLQNEEDIKNLFDFVKEKFGKLDILVNNAGYSKSGDIFDLKLWSRALNTNVLGYITVIKYAKNIINEGKILNISSVYAEDKVAWPGKAADAASKSAINNLTRTIAKEFAPKINVNAIAPGYVDTRLWDEFSPEIKNEAKTELLIGRLIKPSEIAEMATAIIKNDAMTGEVVVVDGGLSLKTV